MRTYLMILALLLAFVVVGCQNESTEPEVEAPSYDDIADILKQRYQGLSTRITFPIPENPEHDKLAAEVISALQAG